MGKKKNSSQSPGILAALFYSALIIGGCYSLSILMKTNYDDQQYAHSHYKPVKAIVKRSSIKTDYDDESFSSDYSLRLVYSYKLNGTTYKSNKYCYGCVEPDDKDADKRFPEGKEITVYYDPADPSKAIVDKSLPTQSSLKIANSLPYIGIILSIFILGSAVLGLRKH